MPQPPFSNRCSQFFFPNTLDTCCTVAAQMTETLFASMNFNLSCRRIIYSNFNVIYVNIK